MVITNIPFMNPKKLVRLPEKNVEEAQRILGNLERRMRELQQQAEAEQLRAAKKLLDPTNHGNA